MIAGDRQYNTGNTSAVSQLKSKTKSKKSKSVITVDTVVNQYIRSSELKDSGSNGMRLRRYTFRFAAESRSHPQEGRTDHLRRLRPYIARFNAYSRSHPLEGRVDRRFGSNPTRNLALDPVPEPTTPVPGPVDSVSVSSPTVADNLASVPGPVDYTSVPGPVGSVSVSRPTVSDNLAPVPGPVDYTSVPGPVAADRPVPRKFVYKALSTEETSRVNEFFAKQDETEVVFEMGFYKYTVEALQRLKDNRWLCDLSIAAYIGICRDTIQNADVHFYDTQLYQQCVKGNKFRGKGVVGKKKLAFIPVGTGSHWSLVVINFESKKFEYYDSMGTAAGEYHVEIIKNACSDAMVPVKEWEIVYPKCNQQTNDDCGVFVCQWIRCLAQGKDIDVVTAERMSFYRRHMLLDILELAKRF